MGEQSQNTMAKIGSTLSWHDLEEQEQRAEGRPVERYPVTDGPQVFGDVAPGIETRPDGVEEDFAAAGRRAARLRNDDIPSGRGLLIAAILVVLAVVALVGVTLVA
jgi:hypothetical protein